MKYAIVRQDGVTEMREDNYPLQDGAIVLNDEQFNQLSSGLFILQNGEIVTNPNPPTVKEFK
jgi:hypothetical protein